MHWFAAACFFERKFIERPNSRPLYEETVFLLECASLEDAEEVARVIAQAEELSYANVYDEVVTWEFTGVVEVQELLGQSFKHGSEVFSRFLNRTAYRALTSRPSESRERRKRS